MTGCIMGVLSLPMSAQGIFNEMSFAADKTVFRLNSPYKTTLRIYKDGCKIRQKIRIISPFN